MPLKVRKELVRHVRMQKVVPQGAKEIGGIAPIEGGE
jgi:hypothetical protein